MPAALRIPLPTARFAWAAGAGLSSVESTPEAACRAAGWARTLGGVDAYFTLIARAPSLTREAIDAAAVAGRIRITPAARGCIYLVPAEDQPLLLRFAEDLSAARDARDRAKAGIDDAEIADLGGAVLSVLTGPMTTDAVRKALPKGAVRSLGEAGKKIGLSSPLPPTLRRLEFDGAIERVPDGSLDSERYRWRRLPEGRFAGVPAAAEGRLAAIVRIVLRTGVALTVDELAAFLGAGKRAIAAAVAALDAVEVAIDDHAESAWALPESLPLLRDPPRPRDAALLAFEDAYCTVHGGPAAVTDPRHHGVPVLPWGVFERRPLREVTHLFTRTGVVDGTVAALWELEPKGLQLVIREFEPGVGSRIEAAAAPTLAAARSLGHARAFVLDTDAEVGKRAAALRAG